MHEVIYIASEFIDIGIIVLYNYKRTGYLLIVCVSTVFYKIN